VDCLERKAFLVRRRLRQRLTGEHRAIPRTISTSPARRRRPHRLAQTGSMSRVRSTHASPAATICARSVFLPAESAIALIAVSIVPSTGFFTARYAASLAPAERLAQVVALG
jgi:hypothetical protein